MDFFEAVAQRGSYREEFLAEEVTQADLTQILTAGIRAPSGYNYQTPAFVAVTDKTLLGEIAELMPTGATETAPAMIVILSEFRQADNGLSFEVEDYAAAAENILLAITALGYAGVWMDGMTKLGNNGEKLEKLLNVPEGKRVRTLIPLGRPAKPVVQKEKLPFSERVSFNRF